MIVAIKLFYESANRIYYFEKGLIDEKYNTEMLVCSVMGLIINLIGLYFFHDHEEEHENGGSNQNTYGIFLHVLADTLGSVGVLLSCYLVRYHDMEIADPICAVVVSMLIFVSVLPLLKISC